jgi:hypothetical protein
MEYISIISSVVKIIVFVLVAGAAVFVAYMSHKNQVKEHFSQDISGINIAFNAVLNRDPTQNEFDHFSEMAKSGFTRIEFETYLNNLKSNIAQAYNSVFKRDPTDAEFVESIPTFTSYHYRYDDIVAFIKTRSSVVVKADVPAFTIPSTTMEGVGTENMVGDAFISVLSRDPTPEEVIKYVNMINVGEITIAKLKDHLLGSEEFKTIQATKAAEELLAGVKEVDTVFPKEDDKVDKYNYEVYVNVISLYQGVLQRNPNQTELDKYYTNIDSDNLTLKELRMILQNSDEYRMLTQSQSNVVNLEMSREMTDRQSNHSITTQFQKVYDRLPTEGEIKFLQDKIKTYSMNDEKLYDYISRLRNMENYEIKDTQLIDDDPDQSPMGFGLTTDDYMVDKPIYKGPGSKYKENEIFKLAEKVSKILSDNSKPQGYTSYVNQRNNADIDYMGAKYQRGFQKESELVSDAAIAPPVHNVPQKNNCPPCKVNPLIDQTSLIGTLLNDAHDTQIGSILPKFTYQNL